MRFKHFLTLLETPLDYENNSMGDDDLEAYGFMYSKKEPKEIIKKEDVEYKIYESFKEIVWIVVKDKEVVGMCKINDKKKFKTVILTIVKSNRYGKGIATNLYKTIIEHYGYIVSDTQLTKNDTYGSWYLYEKLISKYFAYGMILVGNDYKIARINKMPTSKDSRIVLSNKEIKSIEDLK